MTASELGARAQAALDLATGPPPGTTTSEVAERLQQVYDDAGHQPVIRARVAAALARAWADSDPTRGSTFADEAARIAEDLDDAVLLAEALDARLATCAGPDDLVARLETSMWLAEVAAGVTDPGVRLRAHLWRLTTGLEQLDLPTIRRQLAALDLLADETRDARIRFFACARRAMFALTEGDVVGAARLAAEATEAGVAARLPETEAVQRTLHAEMARQRDDRAALTRVAEELEESATAAGSASLLAEAAVLWLEGGRPVRAARIVDRLAPDLPDLPRTEEWLMVVAKTCEAAAGSGRPSAAAACVDLLAPYSGRAVLTTGAVAFAGVVDDYLSLATGEVTQADRARAAYARIGADWWSRRGPLGTATVETTETVGPRVLHLHPVDSDGPTTLWCVGREGAIRTVPTMQGLQYVRLLLESPGVDVPAVELSAAVSGTPVVEEAGALVDQQALTAYRRRVRELDEAIERAEAGADQELTGRLRAERDQVIADARSGGMTAQRGGTQPERTRIAVRQAITAALARLELHDGEVAQALRATIRTGSSCRYEPDPFRPVEWRVSNGHHASQPLVDP